MKKHILDRPRNAPKNWLGHALRIEKAAMPHQGSLSLQRRMRASMPKGRALQFTRVARQDGNARGLTI